LFKETALAALKYSSVIHRSGLDKFRASVRIIRVLKSDIEVAYNGFGDSSPRR
jgi:hypothetical protein